MPNKRYEQVWEGEWDTLDWNNNLVMCCECCLVHGMKFRINDNNKLQVKVKIDRRRTYAARRRAGIKIERTK